MLYGSNHIKGAYTQRTISRIQSVEYSQVGQWVVDIICIHNVSKQNGCNQTHNHAVHTYIG